MRSMSVDAVCGRERAGGFGLDLGLTGGARGARGRAGEREVRRACARAGCEDIGPRVAKTMTNDSGVGARARSA
jgi:hypothetical protein